MRTLTRTAGIVCLVSFGLVAPLRSTALAQDGMTITATAGLTTRGGVTASAPVEIILDRYSTNAEREEVAAGLKSGGTTGVRNVLGMHKQIGVVKVGTTFTPVKFATTRP